MLTALEQGVKGGVWFSLMDKVYAERTLKAAWHRVNANAGAAGIDHVTVAMYERDLDRNLAQLATQLRDGTCRRRRFAEPGEDLSHGISGGGGVSPEPRAVRPLAQSSPPST